MPEVKAEICGNVSDLDMIFNKNIKAFNFVHVVLQELLAIKEHLVKEKSAIANKRLFDIVALTDSVSYKVLVDLLDFCLTGSGNNITYAEDVAPDFQPVLIYLQEGVNRLAKKSAGMSLVFFFFFFY